MKWYKHDPARFLEGVIGLTAAERGAYITLIDLLYARAPLGNVTDDLVTKAMAIDPRTWRMIKRGLVAKGKVRETPNGLMANGVELELSEALNRMRKTRELRVRHLKNQELKPHGNGRTTTTTYTSSSFLTAAREEKEDGRQASEGSDELAEIVRRKGWVNDD